MINFNFNIHNIYYVFTTNRHLLSHQTIVNPVNPKLTGRFQFLKVIGEGASGKVFLAIDHENNNNKVAIKTMDLKSQPKKELIIMEIQIMKENKHPNLVNFIDSFLVDNDLWVVMEYLEGVLTDIVTEIAMSEQHMATVCKEVLKAIDFLHDKNIIHRDMSVFKLFILILQIIKI